MKITTHYQSMASKSSTCNSETYSQSAKVAQLTVLVNFHLPVKLLRCLTGQSLRRYIYT